MRIPGLKSARRIGHWLRTRVEARAIVLGYHRIAEADDDPLGLCTTPQDFERQLEIVRAVTNPIGVDELITGLDGAALPPRALCITIDDGYLDALENAAPRLSAHEVPATVFVVSGRPGRIPWWERLASVVASAPELPSKIAVSAGEHPISVETDAPTAQRALAVRALHRQLIDLPEPLRDGALDAIERLLAPSASRSRAPRLLTAEEVGQLATVPGISIGSHSVSHPRLASLPAAAQRSEIDESRRQLDAILGRPPLAFSYPNGSCTADTHRSVEAAGYACAFTSASGVATAGGNRFALPRFWVGGLATDALARLLRHWG